MINEVKFSKYIETNEFVEDINLDDFIKCKNFTCQYFYSYSI